MGGNDGGNPFMSNMGYGSMFGGMMGPGNSPYNQPQPVQPVVAQAVPLSPPAEEVMAFEEAPVTAYISANAKDIHKRHHTDMYRGSDESPESLDALIVRRGAAFNITILITPYDPDITFRGIR